MLVLSLCGSLKTLLALDFKLSEELVPSNTLHIPIPSSGKQSLSHLRGHFLQEALPGAPSPRSTFRSLLCTSLSHPTYPNCSMNPNVFNGNLPCLFKPLDWTFPEDREQILFIIRFLIPRKGPGM